LPRQKASSHRVLAKLLFGVSEGVRFRRIEYPVLTTSSPKNSGMSSVKKTLDDAAISRLLHRIPIRFRDEVEATAP
jgi:hypothetical protein